MDPPDREVLTLLRIEESSYTEVSLMLDLSKTAARDRKIGALELSTRSLPASPAGWPPEGESLARREEQPMSPESSGDDRDPMEKLAEEFVARHRRGDCPSPAEYAKRYPQWADRINALFPALLLMERVKPAADETSDSSGDVVGSATTSKQLGEFRIIREIGRGGMAIVYEAEQESLGRHVALKILPGYARLDPKLRERFRRESRAAARLHHTNIVPVFGVGEHEGTAYYVMQFIQGQALDEVLGELRRLRSANRGPALEPDQGSDRTDGRVVSAADVAQALMTGGFESARPGSSVSTGSSGSNGEGGTEMDPTLKPADDPPRSPPSTEASAALAMWPGPSDTSSLSK
jgi:Protein kinase domain